MSSYRDGQQHRGVIILAGDLGDLTARLQLGLVEGAVHICPPSEDNENSSMLTTPELLPQQLPICNIKLRVTYSEFDIKIL